MDDLIKLGQHLAWQLPWLVCGSAIAEYNYWLSTLNIFLGESK